MKCLKMLVVVSLMAIVLLEAWPSVAAARPHHPSVSRLAEMRQKVVGRIVAPIAARAKRGGRSRWR
jgi:hypothetical protein